MQHYDELTGQQARLKTKLKARLRMQGVIVTGERLFSAKGRKEILAKVESRDLRTPSLNFIQSWTRAWPRRNSLAY